MNAPKLLTLILSFAAIQIVQADETKPLFPKGDLAKGETVFMEQKCFACHTLEQRKLPDFDLPAKLKIHLGGSAQELWTRDDYAKAIMNPNHVVAPEYQAIMIRIGDKVGAANSPMPTFNEKVTVQNLIDLATFLSDAEE